MAALMDEMWAAWKVVLLAALMVVSTAFEWGASTVSLMA